MLDILKVRLGRFSVRAVDLGLVAVALLLASCADSTAPVASAIEAAEGDAQTGMGGWQLRQPVSVVVRGESGKPMAGVSVHFDAGSAGGRALPADVETDGNGVASTRWLLAPAALGLQTLTASSGSVTTDVLATALAPDAGDVLVVHGALGPLRGVMLLPEINTLEGPMGATPSDTVVPLPQLGASGRGLVIVGHDNLPTLVEPEWTAGPDTVHVQLRPPLEIELAFTVMDGTYALRVAELQGQIQRMEQVWKDAGMGVRVGVVSFLDETASSPSNRFSPGFCSATTAPERIEVAVLTSIDLGVYWGYACPSGELYVTGPNFGDPLAVYLLAHEVGHVFGLGHAPEGVMKPNSTQGSMTLGEVFVANFFTQSTLNTLYSGHAPEELRDCTSQYPGTCIAQAYDLPEP